MGHTCHIQTWNYYTRLILVTNDIYFFTSQPQKLGKNDKAVFSKQYNAFKKNATDVKQTLGFELSTFMAYVSDYI